ncbi:MAG: asparaginase domain-containing protein [Candidatus Uhrbacteria bacterium]|nr:asparaginase domain-containing protein [Candidatus Uhrbacteria bacterium]
MTSKKKILFLYNGGTIGQVPTEINGVIVSAPPKDAAVFKHAVNPIIEKFSEKFDILYEVITTKESSSMTPQDWEKLIFRVKKAQDEEGVDAVGIAHGTDTLCYTATALAFALHGPILGQSGLRIPVCITGSQNPVYQEGGDGRFNLENMFRTLDQCIDMGAADVLVNFWNRVLLGCRAIKVSERAFDAMQTPAVLDAGTINSRGIIISPDRIRLKQGAAEKIHLAPKFARGVINFELTPGLDPNLLLSFITGGGVSAMILKSLGEGNVCSEGAYNLIPVIQQATRDYMTPIFMASRFIGGTADSAVDASGMAAIEAGAIACLDSTDIAIDIKVRWLAGNGICSTIEDYARAMKTSYCGEVTEPIN